MCLLQVTMCSVKVQRQWLSFLSPPSSFSWRQTVRSLAFQLSSETRYCKIDLEMYTTSINLSPPAAPLWAFVSQHLFLSTSQKFLRGSCWSVPQCSSSLLSSWRQPWYFQSNFQDFPKPIIKVRDTLMNVGLANNGKRPVVAIDECQVLNVN